MPTHLHRPRLQELGGWPRASADEALTHAEAGGTQTSVIRGDRTGVRAALEG